jgi:hypothetical protein
MVMGRRVVVSGHLSACDHSRWRRCRRDDRSAIHQRVAPVSCARPDRGLRFLLRTQVERLNIARGQSVALRDRDSVRSADFAAWGAYARSWSGGARCADSRQTREADVGTGRIRVILHAQSRAGEVPAAPDKYIVRELVAPAAAAPPLAGRKPRRAVHRGAVPHRTRISRTLPIHVLEMLGHRRHAPQWQRAPIPRPADRARFRHCVLRGARSAISTVTREQRWTRDREGDLNWSEDDPDRSPHRPQGDQPTASHARIASSRHS